MDYHTFSKQGFLSKDHVLLFQDWFLLFAKNKLDITGQGSGGDTWRLNLSSKQSVNITYRTEEKVIEIQSPIEVGPVVEEIADIACKEFQNNSPTPGSWWSASFYSAQMTIDQNSLLHMFRNLGTFKRSPEKLRMGKFALLLPKDETGEHPPLFPKLNINVIFISPGASGGPFSRSQAEKIIPVINAVLSSCFGTPLMPSPAIFPAKEDKINMANQELRTANIPEVGFEGLPIWSFLHACHTYGAGELADRLIGAMMAYEAGMLQRTDHSTLLFFVSAIEALTVPNLNAAKTQRLSKRFSYFLEEFCSQEIHKVMNHANFEQAFGKIESRKKFIRELYNLRSQPVHTGHFGNYSGMLLSDDQSLKVGLVNDIVRLAIVSLIKCPVSLLWGHPELDPSVTIELEPMQYNLLKSQADKANVTIEKYVKNAVLKNLH